MPQKSTGRKHSNDNTAPAKVITTLDGTKIQITAGRKLQAIRSFASDPEITDAQFRALVCIIDRLNEGKEGTDESRWGSAYPGYDTIAMDIGKDERAAKRIIKELTTGKRETRSKNGERTLVPCKAALNVKSTKNGKTDEVNEYSLKVWGAFAVAVEPGGAVTEQHSGGGAVTGQEGCGHLSEGVRSPVGGGAVTALDSSLLLISETHPTDPPQLAPASGEREPAVGLDEGEGSPPSDHRSEDHASRETAPAASNDNQPEYTATFEEFWSICPRKLEKHKPETFQVWQEIAETGEVSSSKIMDGMRMYRKSCQDREPNYIMFPARWLREKRWTEYAGMSARSSRRQGMAI